MLLTVNALSLMNSEVESFGDPEAKEIRCQKLELRCAKVGGVPFSEFYGASGKTSNISYTFRYSIHTLVAKCKFCKGWSFSKCVLYL